MFLVVEPAHPDSNSRFDIDLAWVLVFLVNYSFKSRRRTCRQRDVCGDFNNFKIQSFGDIHMVRMCICVFIGTSVHMYVRRNECAWYIGPVFWRCSQRQDMRVFIVHALWTYLFVLCFKKERKTRRMGCWDSGRSAAKPQTRALSKVESRSHTKALQIGTRVLAIGRIFFIPLYQQHST